ncbi:MAG: pepsin/retropepsin-like aspartic protease family protein [Bacteroidota bacterium]
MKSIIFLAMMISIASCSSSNKDLPELTTTSKIITIKDGEIMHKEVWTASPQIELDEFITNKFEGKKQVSFMSDIDTLSFTVEPNSTYDFVIVTNEGRALTRINTDTSKAASIPHKKVLEYFTDSKSNKSFTDTIPFTLGDDERVHVKGTINGSETLDFIFDTGANAIVIASGLVGNKVALDLDGNSENTGSDGIHTVKTSSSNQLEIEHLNWDDVQILSIDYRERSFDGVLGWIAFENKIVEIDYENNFLLIHKSLNTVSPDYYKVETKMIRGVPYIKTKISVGDNSSTGWFEYDSGYNGSISMSQKYASENNLNGVMDTVGTAISLGSSGEESISNIHILPSMQLGDFDISNVPLYIAEKDPEGIEYNDLLGNSVLKRFNAVIDFDQFEIYLKPNTLLDTKF